MKKKSRPKPQSQQPPQPSPQSPPPPPTQSNDEEFLSKIRIDPSYLEQPVAKELIVSVPVRRPKKQDFIRVHPDPKYRLDGALIEFERELYLVEHGPVVELAEHYLARLFLAINKQESLFIWPAKIPNSDNRGNRWHITGLACAEAAMTKWVRVMTDQYEGCYRVFSAEAKFKEPEWPKVSFSEILKIAFKDRLIKSPDHPVIKKLLGQE